MICPRCLYRLTTTTPRSLRPFRRLSTTSRLLAPPSTTPNQTTHPNLAGPPQAALSTSAAQPFSTPLTPSTPPLPNNNKPSDTTTSAEAAAAAAAAAVAPRSSVKAGTVLKGLGYVKGKDPPIAKEDSEYPDWLWGLLSEKGGKGESKEGEGDEGDLYSKSKKQRRLASKRAAALAAAASRNPSYKKIPLEQQSIDLPGGDGTVAGAMAAGEAREQVRGAMRRGRRRGIKESNFLKAMR